MRVGGCIKCYYSTYNSIDFSISYDVTSNIATINENILPAGHKKSRHMVPGFPSKLKNEILLFLQIVFVARRISRCSKHLESSAIIIIQVGPIEMKFCRSSRCWVSFVGKINVRCVIAISAVAARMQG